MTLIYYGDINLHNLKSKLFDKLEIYDKNYLDKQFDLSQVLSTDFIPPSFFLHQYNNKVVCPENINQIIELCEFLLIDRNDIQQFIVENSIPTFDNYNLNNELKKIYELPLFMTNNKFKINNFIIESVKLGLTNWVKFGLEEKLYWDNKCYYYVLKNNNIESFQRLKQLDSCYNYEYFSEFGSVNTFLESFSHRNNIQIENKIIGDLIFIDKNNLRSDVSCCPNSSVLSCRSRENNNLSSFLVQSYNIYQVIPNINKKIYNDDISKKIQKILIRDKQLFLNENINGAQYPINWSNIFDHQIFCHYINNIEINIPIYLSSLDFDDFFLDSNNYSLFIKIIKENYYSFDYIVFYFDFQININDLDNSLKNIILKDVFIPNKEVKTSKRYIRGIVDDKNIKVNDLNLNNINDIKQLIMI